MSKKLREIEQQSHLQKLQDSLGYQFKDATLLGVALTHKSYQAKHNERLEFLGDAVLNTSITAYLFEHFPELDEGVLSRVRASLVKGETLAKLAREHALGEHLLLGTGELKSGGFKRASILADAMEAIIGAVYIESGFEQSKAFVVKLYAKRLLPDSILGLGKDPKTALQEYLQSRKLPLPSYQLEKVTGEDHQQVFTVTCELAKLNIKASSSGSNRRSAEKAVARLVLEQINQNA